jgi:imidazolonepropionase
MRELGIIEDGAMLVAGGLIREVGPARRVENLAEARSAEVLDASGCIVLPGFVDSETNLLDAARNDSRSFSNSRLELEARRHLAWFVRHGTTTLAAQASDPASLRVLAALESAIDITSIITGADANSLPIAKGVTFAYPSEECESPAFFATARARGFSVRARAANSVGVAVRAGCMAIVQPDRLSDEDLSLLASSSTLAIFLPCAAIEQRWSYGPARQLIDQGGAAALGTGFGPRSSSSVSMPMALALARLRMGLTPAEALVAATINAAHAVGRARQVGSLEPGKQADFLIADVPSFRDLAHHLGVNLVSVTVKRGKVLAKAPEVAW